METFKLGEFRIELMDDPAGTLSQEERNKIVAESIPVARKGFGNEGVTESDIYTHAIEVSTAVFVRNTSGQLLGFSGCVPETVLGRTVIHLKGSAVIPEFQGHGFYSFLTPIRILNEAGRYGGSKMLIGTRTQSPVVFRFMSKKLGFFPKLDEPIPAELKPVAAAYAAVVREKHSDFKSKSGLQFDKDTFVIHRAYGGTNDRGEEYGFCMYGKNVPWIKDDEQVNKFMQNQLDLNDGDAFLLLGYFSKEKNLATLREAVNKLGPKDTGIVARFNR